MSWQSDLKILVENHMPYAYSVNGARGTPQPTELEEALGYLREFIFIELKKSFIAGHAKGLECASNVVEAFNNQVRNLPAVVFDGSANKHQAERDWQEHSK